MSNEQINTSSYLDWKKDSFEAEYTTAMTLALQIYENVWVTANHIWCTPNKPCLLCVNKTYDEPVLVVNVATQHKFNLHE